MLQRRGTGRFPATGNSTQIVFVAIDDMATATLMAHSSVSNDRSDRPGKFKKSHPHALGVNNVKLATIGFGSWKKKVG